jgi:hypothetical protein
MVSSIAWGDFSMQEHISLNINRGRDSKAPNHFIYLYYLTFILPHLIQNPKANASLFF